MKAELLRRLDALEAVAKRVDIPPLRLVDVLTLEAPDREEYWSGPDGEIAVLTRMGVPIDGESTGSVHTVVIDLHPASREKWSATAGMDDDALEAFEQAAIFQEQIQEREERDAKERARLDVNRNTQTLSSPPANAYTPVPVERD